MSHRKVITMCHWRRPEYSQKSLEYLSRCHGIAEYTVLMHIDGKPDPKVLEECERFSKVPDQYSIVQHPNHGGCNGNTFAALSSGFELSDYVIHLEDDILISRDGLQYFEWASQFENDPKIFTTGIWRNNNGWLPEQKRPWIPGHERLADFNPGFAVWGWATWKNRWIEMKAGWTKGDDHFASWDETLSKNVRGNRCSLLPYISRANNIGEHLGTHRGAAWLSHWADSPGFVEPGRFERVCVGS